MVLTDPNLDWFRGFAWKLTCSSIGEAKASHDSSKGHATVISELQESRKRGSQFEGLFLANKLTFKASVQTPKKNQSSGGV